MTGPSYYVTALSVGAIGLHRGRRRRHNGAGSEDRFLVGPRPETSRSHRRRRTASGRGTGPVLLQLTSSDRLRAAHQPGAGRSASEARSATSRISQQRCASIPHPADRSSYEGGSSRLAQAVVDTAHRQYLSTRAERRSYLFDPGINGTHRYTPDGCARFRNSTRRRRR